MRSDASSRYIVLFLQEARNVSKDGVVPMECARKLPGQFYFRLGWGKVKPEITLATVPSASIYTHIGYKERRSKNPAPNFTGFAAVYVLTTDL
jgi:hypothetical protein